MTVQEEKVFLLFPPWKLMVRFLLVTMLIVIGTAFSGLMVFLKYFDVSPSWLIGVGFSVIVVFSLINFSVIRGSFFCSRILKYYTLFLIAICIPLLIIVVDRNYYLLVLLNFVVLISAVYLISGKTYQKFVQYQNNFFKEIKETKKAVENELAKPYKSKSRS